MNTVYVSIALVVFWCAVTTTAMAGRIGLSSYLAQRLATNPWEAKCGVEGDPCYSSDECCQGNKCLANKSFRGPRFICVDMPTRMHRHLLAPALVPTTPETKLGYEGANCDTSNDCDEELCCHVVLFRSGGKTKVCRKEEPYSLCY